MEKMNQVSVSEFFAKSKEEMYDMAVEMVEKYNRLVDICNDSAERMAGLVKERDEINMQHAALAVASVGMIKERDEKIKELTHRIDNYKSWNEEIKKLKEEVDSLEAELKRKDEVIETLCNRIFNLKTELSVQQKLREKEINELKKKYVVR